MNPNSAETVRTVRPAVLPGDGIGAEVMAEAVRVLCALERHTPRVRFELHEHPAGAAARGQRGGLY